jgi:glucose-6-phosphate isomerase
MATDLVQAPAWKALQRHASAVWLPPDAPHLRDVIGQPGRFKAFSRRQGDCLLDFSRNRLSEETLGLLIALAGERNVPASVEALFAGQAVNFTENRPALHMALRGPDSPPLIVGSADIRPEITAERERMLLLADSIRSGDFLGATGARIRHVVNIGIGGSDLGLVMATEALHEFCTDEVQIHYVSNVDGNQLADVLARAPAAQTLFIICSKSFSTWETALNAAAARDWLVGQLGEGAVARHFVAVSVNAAAMDKFGIAQENRFRIWDWVGGRYSLWSSIGLAIAIAIGSEHFRDLLAGGRELDEHFRTAPLVDNLPVLLALIAVWNQNFLGATSQAILPYDSRLHRFAAYLQQLEMESNGKGVTREGRPVEVTTGTVIWGEPGNNAQHSFFQLLHQGTANFSADFIAPVEGSSRYADQHLVGLANMLAQAEAFARGYTLSQAQAELVAAGKTPADAARLAPHKVHPGNRPSTILLLRRLDPRGLGFLIALYEHKVFVQACIWGINPFDQWGVELGKHMATGMYGALQSASPGPELPGIGAIIRGWASG